MSFDFIGAAARNNASMCNKVCRAHGCATEFVAGAWITHDPPPPYHSNLVTTAAGAFVKAQQELIRTIVANDPTRGFGLKDSYFAIDPVAAGGTRRFKVLFEASWFGADVHTLRPAPSMLAWNRVTTSSEFADWEHAWRDAGNSDAKVHARQFPETLLADADLAYLAGRDAQGQIVAVAVANRSDDDVVGLSNVTTLGAPMHDVWAGALSIAMTTFDGSRWLVGYERGEKLRIASALGLTARGPLRVFVMD